MAGKRLNKSLVVSLTLFALVMMVVVSVLVFRQLQRRDPKYFVELAKQYEDREEWKPAAAFYRKAWERSHDAAYLVSFGDMLLHDGEVVMALNSWRAALINEPTLTSAHLHQLKLLLDIAQMSGRTDDWNRVRQAAETFLKSEAKKDAHQAALAHHVAGLALFSLAAQNEGNVEKGEVELRRAVKLAPDVVDYSVDLATHYLDHGRRDDGERLFAELIEQYPTAGAAASKIRLAYARYRAQTEDFAGAERYFKEARSLAASDPAALRDARLGYAVFLAQQWARAVAHPSSPEAAAALFDEAEAILKACIEADPDDYEPYLQLAALYGMSNRHADKVAICEARLQRGLSRTGLKAARNRVNAFSLMIYASEACVAQAVIAHRAGASDEREAWTAKAQRYLAAARGEFPSHPQVLHQAGRIKLAQGLDRQALDDFRSADEAYRDYNRINWDNKLMLARVHLRLGEPGAAQAVLEEVAEEAMRRNVDARYWILYARTLFQNKNYDRAMALADQILAAAPDNVEARRIKAAVYEARGREKEAAELLAGGSIARTILTARAYALEGDEEHAVAVLRRALEKDPANPRLVSVLIRELLFLGRAGDARTILRDAQAAAPDDANLQTLAVLAREDLSPDQRSEAIRKIIEAQKDGYLRALELAGFHLRRNETERGLKLIDEALAHLAARDTPAARDATIEQHRALLVAKLQAGAALHNETALAEARDDGIRHNVDGANGKSILGLYHMLRAEYELAIRAFREATELQPTDARSLTFLGQCLQIGGRGEEAKASYDRAVRVNPDAGTAYKGLAMLAKARDDTDAYERALTTCERLIPSDPWVRSEILAREEQADPEAAITRRRALLRDNPEDIDNLKRLAMLCEAVRDLTAADEYVTRLLRLRPDDKSLVVEVYKYYLRTGRPQRALALVTRYAESRETAEAKANAQILVASYYLKSGDLDQAERTLLAAADTAETFEVTQSLAEFYRRRAGKPEKALPWLDKVIQRARADRLPQLAQAMAARISCLLQPSLDDTQTARKYVDELLATFPHDAQGLLLDGELHARVGEIAEAIDSLTEYLRQQPDDPYALYQRALHQRSQGRVTAAIEDLRTIKRTNPLALDLRPRLLLARLYHQGGQTELWIRELESLVQDAPASDRALQELVRAYVREERLIDAERVVTVRINRNPAETNAPWFFLRSQVALKLGDEGKALADAQHAADIQGHTTESVVKVLGTYGQLGRAAPGIRYYEQYAGENPTAALISRYARLLVQAGRAPQAAAQFRRAMTLALTESPMAIRNVGADLRAAFPTVSEAAEAITLFERFGRADANGRVNDRILVDLYRIAQRPGEAIDRLRKLIATSPDDRERAGLLHELGDVCQEAGRPDAARQAYEESLQFNANNWVAMNNLAYVLCDQLGEPSPAADYARRAVVIAENAATLDTLGWAYVGVGDYRRAIAALSRAVRLDPDHALSYYHLGEAYRRNGASEEAENILTSGQDLARQAGDAKLLDLIRSSLDRLSKPRPLP